MGERVDHCPFDCEFQLLPFIVSYLDLLKSKWLIFIYFMWVGCRVCVLGLLFCCQVVEKARIF